MMNISDYRDRIPNMREHIDEWRDRIPNMREHIDEWRDRVPEMRERIDEWRAELPEPETMETVAGAALLGTGLIALLGTVLAERRGLWAWFLPAVLLTSGASLLVAGALQRREVRIEVAEEAVRSELASLDPIARAKVMKEVAEEQLSVFSRRGAGAES